MDSYGGVNESKIKEVPLFYRGKVRDLYDLGDKILIVSTDRISAFDFILPTLIPGKGKILTQISAFWFNYLSKIIPNHMISIAWEDFPSAFAASRKDLEGRSMLVKKLKRINIECVVRGYLAGSGWKEYQKNQIVGGIKLPKGLVESEKLPAPIFTPATKESQGAHDINITFQEMAEMIGETQAGFLKEKSLALYRQASVYAQKRNIIIADTKFEFGVDEKEGKVFLIDEALTPDSSRFWELTTYQKGRAGDNFDKQFIRDFLEGTGWDKISPPPQLPLDTVKKTREKYQQAYRRLTAE